MKVLKRQQSNISRQSSLTKRSLQHLGSRLSTAQFGEPAGQDAAFVDLPDLQQAVNIVAQVAHAVAIKQLDLPQRDAQILNINTDNVAVQPHSDATELMPQPGFVPLVVAAPASLYEIGRLNDGVLQNVGHMSSVQLVSNRTQDNRSSYQGCDSGNNNAHSAIWIGLQVSLSEEDSGKNSLPKIWEQPDLDLELGKGQGYTPANNHVPELSVSEAIQNGPQAVSAAATNLASSVGHFEDKSATSLTNFDASEDLKSDGDLHQTFPHPVDSTKDVRTSLFAKCLLPCELPCIPTTLSFKRLRQFFVTWNGLLAQIILRAGSTLFTEAECKLDTNRCSHAEMVSFSCCMTGDLLTW